ncbi:MAG: glucose-6-phosphate dehydrogenase, partial [Rhodococcus sp.]|nr:glucose-6-phosphate dehydrogenase [Rhodococcus sp. (in: high G+C Gram-positive bacteria)]
MATTTLLILGASGDLTSRLLLPALGQLLKRQSDRQLNLVGAGSDDWSTEKWRGTVAKQFAEAHAETETSRVIGTTYQQVDVTSKDAMQKLLSGLGDTGPLVIYFALPPAITWKCCEVLGSIKLPKETSLALEKPFGSDADSAQKLNEMLLGLVPESRIFRVDHFLGESTFLSILGTRLANRVFTPIWNAEHVESVDIIWDETLTLEDRARYYDHAGALEDMIQSHLLQVLSLVALEAPATLNSQDLRSAQAAALRATRIWRDDPKVASQRARYTAGTIGSRKVVSYVDEPGVDPTR